MKRQWCMLLAGVVAGTASVASAVDNVILFIGDGMGAEHIKAARAYVNGSTARALTFEGLGFSADSVTALPDGTITDSATAGTAIATGYQHPANGIISMGANNAIKTTLLEHAKAKGMRTAIITTDDIGGATPGVFGAHEPDRSLLAAIRADYLRADTAQGHSASLPDVLLGGGYDDPAVVPGTVYNYVDLAQSLGYQFVSSAAQLNAAGSGRILGLFGGSWAPMTTMASRTEASTQPTLSQMLSKALEVLENAGGFFVIVESANIDKLSHSKSSAFVKEVAELDEAVKVAINWRDQHDQFDSTFIFVTADHETGGLVVPAQSVEPGTLPAMTFTSTEHTAANVPLFGNWPPEIDGLELDNTDTFFVVQDALNYSRGGYGPSITGLTVSGVTETSATVQWTTVEPSDSRVELTAGGQVFTFYGSGPYSHSVDCRELSPGTTYSLKALSTDLAQFTGQATSILVTVGGSPDAVVIAEPVISLGTVSGTYQGVSTAGDGQKQMITEAAEGAGAGVTVTYTLHTPVAVSHIKSLLLQASYSWMGDSAADAMFAYVRVEDPVGGYLWEKITFPFVAEPASSYVDGTGNVVVRFEDAAAIKRERKDILAIDYLVGKVEENATAMPQPAAPKNVHAAMNNGTQLPVNLTWADSDSESGYLVWRHSTSDGWKVLAQLLQNATSYADATAASSTTYSYVVRAYNADNFADSQPVSMTIPVILSAPSSFKASAVKGAINLTWLDNNSTETGYEVLRGTTSDGNFTSLAKLAANTASYSDRNIVKATTYYYQVRAIKDAQNGPVSATASATAR